MQISNKLGGGVFLLAAALVLNVPLSSAVVLPTDQTVLLDFRQSIYIDPTSVYEMSCSEAGCSPTAEIRPIDQNIQALWRLDEIADDNVMDASVNHYNLGIVGAVASADASQCRHGACLDFADDSINYAYGLSGPFGDTVVPESGYTISFWIYPRVLSGYVFASFYSSRVYFNGSTGEIIYYIESDPVHASIRIDADAVSAMTDRWTQLSFRFNNETRILSAFINGVLFKSVQTNVESFKHDNQDFTLGNSVRHTLEDQFSGMIDEFVVYDSVLDEAAIDQLFAAGRPPTLTSASFATKELEFAEPIESFMGTLEETGGGTRVAFSTDGGKKWCDVAENEASDRRTCCYFPTESLLLKFSPIDNTSIESFTLQTSTAYQRRNDGKFPIGMNLTSHSYWSRQILFADAMKRAPAFYAADYPWWSDVEVDYADVFDANGYPRYAPMEMFDNEGNSIGYQEFNTFLYLHADGEYPKGEYVLFFSGDGTVELGNDAGHHMVSSDGTAEVRYPFSIDSTSSLGVSLTITSSDSMNPVRNIRVVTPGHEATYATNPFYLPLLEKFKNFENYRFMDLMETNNQDARTWADVRPKSYFSQSASYPTHSGHNPGLSPEYLVSLANVTRIDPWFCIPHKADDQYVRNLATLIHDNLDPDLEVYVEYSNELWNWMFEQTHYCLDQGTALGLDADDGNAKDKFVLKRSVEIFTIFEEVFGEDRGRIVKIISGQSANVNVLKRILSHIDDPVLNPGGMEVDAIAIAPYIHIDDEDVRLLAPTVSEITYRQVAQLCLEAVFEHNLDHIAAHRQLADQYGVKLIAYEGGQHLGFDLDPNDPLEKDLIALYTGMNRDDTIGIVTGELLDVWGDYSDGLFSYFSSISSYGRYGSWGVYESTFEEETPKSRMLSEWTDARWLLMDYDYNGDGEVDIDDLILGLKVLSGHPVDLAEDRFTGDKRIDLKGCLFILRSLSGH